MDKLRINGSQKFMGINIPIIEGGFGESKRVVLEKQIAEIHNMEVREVRKSIARLIDKGRLIKNVDYIDLLECGKEFTTFELLQFYAKSSLSQAKNVFILSERGYTKLIKAMDDDKSWEVMDQFVDSYFTLRQQVKIMLSDEDKYILNLYHAETKEDMLMLIKQHEQEVVKPLRDSLDRYERFLCEKTGILTKTELSTKLDTKPQTLAAKLKKAGVYTKTSQISGEFLKKYPDTKIIVECNNTYVDDKGVEHTKPDFQWTHEGSKILVDYLISIGMVTYTDNNGFKLNVT